MGEQLAQIEAALAAKGLTLESVTIQQTPVHTSSGRQFPVFSLEIAPIERTSIDIMVTGSFDAVMRRVNRLPNFGA